MEIAIPLVALGGMYIISNQPSRNCEPRKKLKSILKNGSGSSYQTQNQRYQSQQPTTENFTNMGATPTNLGVTSNYLPNSDIPPVNYPSLDKNN